MTKPIGLIDLGSNSVRLALYAAADSALVPLYNEKEICQLGKGLETSGKLNKAGTQLALKALVRFKLLAESRGVKNIPVLATEAVRNAADGRAFVEKIRLQTGLTPIFVSGEDEARYSAAGVTLGIRGAKGIMGDLGGGSLELAQVGLQDEKLASLNLGLLRLADMCGGDIRQAREITNAALGEIDWLGAMHRRTFYAVGGAWRTLAKAHLKANKHPLNVIHMYEVDAPTMADWAAGLSQMPVDAIGKLKGVSQKRREMTALAALLLERVIAFGRPDRICFSAMGLREGYLYSQLPEAEQKADPLLRYSGSVASEDSLAAALPEWIGKLFRNEEEARLRIAACQLSNLDWGEHPEYRAKQAYQHCLGLPIGGITHSERCFLALALYARHAGEGHAKHTEEALALLSAEQAGRAIALGCVLRLAYELTGGATSLLQGTSLKSDGKDLVLSLNVKREGLLNSTVERRLAAAAAQLSLNPRIETRD